MQGLYIWGQWCVLRADPFSFISCVPLLRPSGPPLLRPSGPPLMSVLDHLSYDPVDHLSYDGWAPPVLRGENIWPPPLLPVVNYPDIWRCAPLKTGVRISGGHPSYKSFPSYQHHTMDHSLNKKHHSDPTPSTNHTPPSNDYMTILLPSESNPRPNGGLPLLPGSGLPLLPGSGLPLTHQPTPLDQVAAHHSTQ